MAILVHKYDLLLVHILHLCAGLSGGNLLCLYILALGTAWVYGPLDHNINRPFLSPYTSTPWLSRCTPLPLAGLARLPDRGRGFDRHCCAIFPPCSVENHSDGAASSRASSSSSCILGYKTYDLD